MYIVYVIGIVRLYKAYALPGLCKMYIVYIEENIATFNKHQQQIISISTYLFWINNLGISNTQLNSLHNNYIHMHSTILSYIPALLHVFEYPPSTTMTAPLMKAALSDAMNMMSGTMLSSHVPTRPRGIARSAQA